MVLALVRFGWYCVIRARGFVCESECGAGSSETRVQSNPRSAGGWKREMKCSAYGKVALVSLCNTRRRTSALVVYQTNCRSTFR